MSVDYAKTIQSRVARARKYVDAFHLASIGFINSNAYKVIRDEEPEDGNIRHTWSFQVLENIPDELSLDFGEAVHHIRAICDNLVTMIGRTRGFTMTSRLRFPIYTESGTSNPSKGFAKWSVDNKKLGSSVISAIRDFQPFNPATDSHGRVWVGADHPLQILDDLWGYDKHQMPLETTGIYLGFDLSGNLPGGTIVAFNEGFGQAEPGTTIEHGMPFLTLVRPNDELTGNMEVKFAAKIGLKEPRPAPFHQGADELLVHMHHFVEHAVVKRLMQFLT